MFTYKFLVSLLHLADITEEGVTFQSPVDGKPMLLTPEESIQIQVVIIRSLSKSCSMWNYLPTLRMKIVAFFIGRQEHSFLDTCVRGLVERNLPGYAIGGLAGGEDKDSFWRVVAQCTASLPESKPRYVMGVGYPLDIVVCSALGADMYDCVYPTRTARFGTALVPE
nr:queuine tRNA-ribosyltransferase-like [Tanacetum cinerariifolium]